MLLTSCMKGVAKIPHMVMDDDKLADACVEKVFNSLKNKDTDELKSLFSKKAISEADNFNDSVDDLLSFIQGDLLSWNLDDSPVVSEEIENGNNSKQLVIWFYLKTNKQNYLVFLVDYPVDTINKDNAGLYSLRIIKAEGEDKWTKPFEDYIIPGINIGL